MFSIGSGGCSCWVWVDGVIREGRKCVVWVVRCGGGDGRLDVAVSRTGKVVMRGRQVVGTASCHLQYCPYCPVPQAPFWKRTTLQPSSSSRSRAHMSRATPRQGRRSSCHCRCRVLLLLVLLCHRCGGMLPLSLLLPGVQESVCAGGLPCSVFEPARSNPPRLPTRFPQHPAPRYLPTHHLHYPPRSPSAPHPLTSGVHDQRGGGLDQGPGTQRHGTAGLQATQVTGIENCTSRSQSLSIIKRKFCWLPLD